MHCRRMNNCLQNELPHTPAITSSLVVDMIKESCTEKNMTNELTFSIPIEINAHRNSPSLYLNNNIDVDIDNNDLLGCIPMDISDDETEKRKFVRCPRRNHPSRQNHYNNQQPNFNQDINQDINLQQELTFAQQPNYFNNNHLNIQLNDLLRTHKHYDPNNHNKHYDPNNHNNHNNRNTHTNRNNHKPIYCSKQQQNTHSQEGTYSVGAFLSDLDTFAVK
jgi:hypothetical protein